MSDSLKHLLIHDTTVYVVLAISSHTEHLNSAMFITVFFFVKLSTSLIFIHQAILHVICW